VELLIVIGIIAVLISILLPALRKSREAAKTVQCASNLRQLGIALRSYAVSNRDALPGWCAWVNYPRGSDPSNEDPNPAWTEQLEPYFAKPNGEVYNCPAFPEGTPMNYFLEARWAGAMGLRSMKFASLRLSTQFVISGDCVTPEFYKPPFGTGNHAAECDKDDETFRCLIFRGEQGGINIHPQGNNVLFADGHVQPFAQFDPTSITFHPATMQAWQNVTPTP
jgi:prepilin-type processing-associated H-X9-DG protein